MSSLEEAVSDVGLVDVKMPQMGVSVTEGTVTAWHKSPGDRVEQDEAICDIATDKVDTEVLSPAAGVLHEILIAAGETVEIGVTLARLGAGRPGDGAASRREPVQAAQPAAGAVSGAPAVRPSSNGAPTTVGAHRFEHLAVAEELAGRLRENGLPAASPLARRLAVEHGLDIATIQGSGMRGRIRKADVEAAAERAKSSRFVAPAATAAPAGPQAAAAPAGPQAAAAPAGPQAAAPAAAAPEAAVVASAAGHDAIPRGYEDVPFEEIATTRMRRITAEHMIRSRQTAAHMTTEVEVDLQRLTGVRAQLNAQRSADHAAKVSFLPFVARVACAALLEFPDLNSTFEQERWIRWGEINVGIAVDTPQGLLVPVIRRCQELTVEAISDRIVDLAQRARSRRLDAEDMRAGTFTISNPGSVGAVSAMAIINQPQVAILGVPAIVRRPWVVALPDGGESIAVRPILKLAITFDHRAIDGAEATRCAVAMKRRLESWELQDYR